MNVSFKYNLLILVLSSLFLSGCYLEQGKLHFDELNLNPITVYAMQPLETTIYCVAEGDFPSGTVLESMHRQSLQQVENNPEDADWGELVCLSLSENATKQQMRETSNVLLLVMASRKDLRGAVRGFKKILDQRVRKLDEIEEFQELLVKEAAERENLIAKYEEQLEAEKLNAREFSRKQGEKITDLEQQVQKLKDVELLLTPNKTTNQQ